MRAFQTKPLKYFALGIYDGPHATPKESADGAIYLGIRNITEDGHLDYSDTRYVSEEELPRWTKRVTPKQDDVVLTYEATLHRYALIPEGFRGCLGRRVALVRPDPAKTDSRFLLYYFLSQNWRSVIESFIITGATVDRLPIEKLPEFPVSLPSLPAQKTIASILSAYDDLIENNRRRMALLEESARLLYREWFVHLRFPGSRAVGSVKADGHARTRITDGLPKGWERKTLGDIADVNRATLPSGFDGEIEYVDIASVTPGQINETTAYDFRDAPSRARRVVQHGDIIWSCVRPNRRSHAVIWNPPNNLIASTGFAVITPKDVPATYLYCATTTDAFVGYLENHARGAAYPAVVAKDFERAEVVVPSNRLLADFNEIVEPTFSQTHTLRQQNQKLRAARDLLLPRLMSGEIAPPQSARANPGA